MIATVDHKARRLAFTGTFDGKVDRALPVEAPVAIEYNGLGYAVMMATPETLEDFATGFTLSEGLVKDAKRIEAIDTHEADGGWVVRVRLPQDAMEPVIERARNRVSESSCGLCGMDNIAAVLSPLPPVTARIATTRGAIAKALDTLAGHQPLGQATGAMHAAAFCTSEGEIVAAAEDVGRHNALDKLLGKLARTGTDPATGFLLLSARCSFELVEKAVRANCPLLVTISAPTSLAVDRATASGLALAALTRSDSTLIFNDPQNMISDG